MHDDVAVQVHGLTKRFGSTLAVDDVSFTVPRGRVVGFLGPNGAGKSTTMRMMVGLTAPTAGEARFGGVRFHDLADPTRTVGSIVDGVDHHPGRRAIQELAISALAAGIPRRRCDEVLDLVGLGAVSRKRVGEFSLGMRQRLGLAQALLGDPEILLLDEPANGLDPEGIHWVRSLLRHFADQGRAILVSSHLLTEVSRLADEVLVIRQGRLVAHASVDELTAGGGAVLVASDDDPGLAASLRRLGADVTEHEAELTVVGLEADEVGRAARDAGVALRRLQPRSNDLEAVFMELTAGEEIA